MTTINEPLPSALEVPTPGARTIRTFLADDCPFMLAYLSRLLRKDHRIAIVGVATDGLDAVQSVSESVVDLVLLDFHMPGLDGAEAAGRLKRLPRPPRILLVTSDDCAETRARGRLAGADGFLPKAPDLAITLHQALRRIFDDPLVLGVCPTR